MKTRLAHKIWNTPINRLSGYWLDRHIDYFMGKTKFDHRILAAEKIILKERRREAERQAQKGGQL